MTHAAPDPGDVAALRAFNRLYTRRLGLLNDRLDGSAFALTEARVLYELAHRPGGIAADIGRSLGLDRAQLSRILRRFADRGLLTGDAQGRTRMLRLTPAGRTAFEELNRRTDAAVSGLLGELPPPARRRLVAASREMAGALGAEAASAAAPGVILRDLRAGDLGWIAHRQAILYRDEYDWDLSYEALAVEILAGFVRDYDPAREQAWIAELGGVVVGSVFLVRGESPDVGRLRLLYVEPSARGQGLGGRLVAACIARARAIGCRRLVLWTNSVLVSACRIYEAAGFRLVEEAPHRSFGHDLIGQTWALELQPASEAL
ncbi:bifunctional helix-turn-helix transcriptional regulator/GNAT family N-acetyltransferase [Phenylobacterium sp. LjRoot225]|uniref:bifunctional helix-turn-helix transcriptional regulator/GNAT family N-acetyltransferase n=1 Tax=Phenylobacterium sp. LjRoot225 TaxID=3342285 RepID=UPI003ECDC09E